MREVVLEMLEDSCGSYFARTTNLARLRILLAVAFAAFMLSVLAGCSSLTHNGTSSRMPDTPVTPWKPPNKALRRLEETRKQELLPEELLASKDNWTLEDIIDIALRNNPDTRATWAAARAEAANVGIKQGAYYPQVELNASYSKTKNAFSSEFSYRQTSYGASLALHYILLDFGQRRAYVEEARQAFYSASWTHNATIQKVVLEVERVYFQYLYAKALVEANGAAVEESEKNLDAAQQRREAGLATIADVLQARSIFAQKKLALQTIEGQIQVIRGSLAAAMGLPPTVDYDVGTLPDSLPGGEVEETVEELIRTAEVYRPDLAALRATAFGARAHVNAVKAEGRPTISLDGNISRRYYDNPDDYSDNYMEGIFLSFPLFTGFAHHKGVIKARAEADLAEQKYRVRKSEVELDVWTSYYDLKTAGERVTTTWEFLESATESHDVALERYRAGVGTILELLSAQTSLEEARVENLRARTDWLLALSQLAYTTGRLEVTRPIPAANSTLLPGKDGN